MSAPQSATAKALYDARAALREIHALVSGEPKPDERDRIIELCDGELGYLEPAADDEPQP